MSDRRKLQGEIERCKKKVSEGVEIFEDIWKKVHSAPNHNQRDKYEQELKKEIKKLQRLRDQIKGWMSSSDIKDKTALQDARKTIEQQMERFKLVEREMKTKAYSNEGLGAGRTLDPLEKEKIECNQWITEALQKLQIQVDKCESDIELLSAGLKKKKSDKDKQERLEESRRSMERHKYHIKMLEKILRGIDNDAVDLKPIHNLREDIEYYIESNHESDFEENKSMYEDIDMDNLASILVPVIAVPTPSHPPSISNGNSSNLCSNISSTLSDLSAPIASIHTIMTSSSERTGTTSTGTSVHGDNESILSLTTPSSPQPSSPGASSAISSADEQKRNRCDTDDQTSQRNRSNSSTNGSSGTTIPYLTSPKNPPSYSTSTGPVSSNKNLPTSSSISSSAPPHFTYPISSSTVVTTPPTTTTTTTTTITSPPFLPYSAIVSQNTPSSISTTTTSVNSTVKQQTNTFSPPSRQISRQLSSNTNDVSMTNTPTVTTSSINSLPNIVQAPSISTISNDRTSFTSQHSSTNSSQTVSSSSTSTLANGTTMQSSLYPGSGSTMTSANIPLESTLASTNIEPMMSSQVSSKLSRTISEHDRSIHRAGSSQTLNGTPDAHTVLDSNAFSNLSIPTTPGTVPSTINANTSAVSSSAFLSTSAQSDHSTNNGALPGQMSEQSPLAFQFSSSLPTNHGSTQTIRVPLTPSEKRILSRLNSAYTKLPSLLESERQRTNANRIYGRNPLGHGQIIPHYPQTPSAGSDTPEFYYRLAPETLFFVFYYMEGTHAQYLAAKALKRQSWRFHTKHMTWFQRYEEPKTITDDYEQGTYIYFDYERWLTRKRENFMFEYKFLEDREF